MSGECLDCDCQVHGLWQRQLCTEQLLPPDNQCYSVYRVLRHVLSPQLTRLGRTITCTVFCCLWIIMDQGIPKFPTVRRTSHGMYHLLLANLHGTSFRMRLTVVESCRINSRRVRCWTQPSGLQLSTRKCSPSLRIR